MHPVSLTPFSLKQATKQFIDEVFSEQNIKNSFTLNFSGHLFSPEAFDYLCEQLRLNVKSKKIFLHKSSLTHEQINKILKLTNSNQKKGLIVCKEDGSPFGPVYTDYSVYYAEKRLRFIEELNRAEKASFPITNYINILNETTSVALCKLWHTIISQHLSTNAVKVLLDNKKNSSETTNTTCQSLVKNFLENYFADRKANYAKPLRIIDFGSGEGKDSIPLLRILNLIKLSKDIKLIAIDANIEANANFKKLLKETEENQVEIYKGSFIEFQIAEPVDVFISSFTWPYRPSQPDFDLVWQKTVDLIKPGGIIAGHFFGEPKTSNSAMTYHTKNQALKLLNQNFEVLWFYTENEKKIRPNGQKREIFGGEELAWGNLYHFVAKRKSE